MIEHSGHQIPDSSTVLVEIRREGRRPVVMDYESYAALEVDELVGTTVTLFVRCDCGAKVQLSGPLAVLASVVRRVGGHYRVGATS